MAHVTRIIGGPGTGKTTLIRDRLTSIKKELGLSAEQIGLCTFTRAGRQELSERCAAEWGVSTDTLTRSGWFRTAHSIAYRQTKVDDGQLLQGKEGGEWTSNAVGGRVTSVYDPSTESFAYGYAQDVDTSCVCSLRAWDLARARMTSVGTILGEWRDMGESADDTITSTRIIEKYESAKRRDGRLDFTDIVAAYAGVRFSVSGGPESIQPVGELPAGMRVLAIDEAQDSSSLVDLVCRRLASGDEIERVLLTGDPYQSIYGFGGSDFRHFMSWEADEEIMPKSYRCPANIMALGEKCIKAMKSGYRNRGIVSAPHEGSIRTSGDANDAVGRIKGEESVLVLARCRFALVDYEKELRDRGLPFCWIDKVGSASQAAGFQALWDLGHGETVCGEDWSHAIAMTRVTIDDDKILVRGEKKAWADGLRSDVDAVRPIDDGFALAGATPRFAQMILAGQWVDAMEMRVADRAKDWLAAAKKHGPELATNPRIKLSTIHSAKGMEADTVILSTSTSGAVERGRLAAESLHDEECRVAYVGVTRTKRALVIVDDGSKNRMEVPV